MEFKPCVACFAVCALLLGTAQSAGARGSPSDLPHCTVIAVQMVDTLDSAKAHVGDFFRFQTINAVVLGNDVIFPAHTSGWGIVSVAVPAGKGGRAGSLVLEPLYFKMPDGKKVGVALDHNAGDLQASGASNNLPGYLGAIPVLGVGAVVGAFDYFHHGKDITVAKATIFAVFPSNDPAVAACRRKA
jgi:hypothetical protein